MPAALPDSLPPQVKRFVADFLEAAQDALGDELVSAVLFGSAAEGRLRTTSDVNVLLLLRTFQPERLEPLRNVLKAAEAAISLRCMFLLQSELGAASELFAMKFGDIAKRNIILLGEDPFAAVQIPRGAEIIRLRQELLNQTLRLRDVLATDGSHDERLSAALAEMVGPLRVAAQTLLRLEGETPGNPRESLILTASQTGVHSELVPALSTLRETGRLPPGQALSNTLQLLTLLAALRERAERLH